VYIDLVVIVMEQLHAVNFLGRHKGFTVVLSKLRGNCMVTQEIETSMSNSGCHVVQVVSKSEIVVSGSRPMLPNEVERSRSADY